MQSTVGVFRHLTLVCICSAGLALADNRVLTLTAEEFDANVDYRERDASIIDKPIDEAAPQILIESPDIGEIVAPPVDILVKFQTSDGALIDIDTLTVRYGWFDITNRVLESMTVTANGIAGKLSSMRQGKYTLNLTISDDQNRSSSEKIRFTIADNQTQADNNAGTNLE